MHSKVGNYFTGKSLPNSTIMDPYNGLPLHVIEQIGDDPVTGNAGIIYYFSHFLRFEGPLTEGTGGGWTLSGVTGAATITRPNTRIGEIILTADGTGNCDPTLAFGEASSPAQFIYTVGKRIWWSVRLNLLTVASMETFVGLGTPDTEPTVSNTFPSDGIFFHKTTSATKLSFDVRKDGTSTSKASITGTLTDATYTTLGIHVDKSGNIIPYQDGIAITSGIVAAGASNIPGAADVMQPMIAFRGASMTLTLDWVLFAQDV